jgi:hypothetical protein
MWHGDRLPPDVLALQAHVERAGYAMACAFSSSAEFEAAVIKSRRDAGAYGRSHAHRFAIGAGIVCGMLLIAFFMI